MTRKVLISPHYGAGWSTWNGSSPEATEMLLFDPQLIAAVEEGLTQEALDDFVRRFETRFPDDPLYTGGARNLVVCEVDGQFRVEEYDGFESLRFRDSDDWF